MAELAKAYEPTPVEEKHYDRWLEAKYFAADENSDKEPFSIVIPPPNVTGILTLGHVLNNTIQDILCRHARMQGKEVLWLPGTDHAGLATQTKVEQALRKEGKSRDDLGREAFLERVWEWKEKHGGIIIQQLKKLGCSCDWDRERFTMDDDYYAAVTEAFVKLYECGYIYRGLRMVNWCPKSLTAISDEEVIPTEQKSKLYTMRYEVAEEPGRFVLIATTRPETLMGDTGVAVNPDDERYKDLIGKHVYRPFPKAKIPVVADDHVEKDFGTGVLKVTPAHDKADFEIGQRHDLPIIDVLTPRGKINCPEYEELHGMDRFEARKKAAEILEEMGQLEKVETYVNNVGFSERGQVPIEPRLSEQWFFKYPKIEESLKVVKDHNIRFWPDRWEKVYNHWLKNIQDWCISRQIWWGHRIPVWYKGDEVKCQVDSPGEGWTQDEDALDTWFSSWLWAYQTMDTKTREKFYPTSVLVTGPDIIFLWVARMIIAGLEFKPGTDDSIEKNLAFKDVYFTGLIRDSKGRKLSKSLGNSPDPLDLFGKFGADGVRFGLMRIAPQGQDIRYDEKQIEEGRNFANKLWNSCRFRAMQGELDPNADPFDPQHELSPFALYLLNRLDQLIARVDDCYEKYDFSAMCGAIYAFVWDDFCSRFIEVAKGDFNDENSPTRSGTLATIDYTISRVLRLLHPYCPFLTEELWLGLGFGKGKSVTNADTIQFESWPSQIDGTIDEASVKLAEEIYATVDAGRSLRGEFQIASNKKVKMQLKPSRKRSASEEAALKTLLNLEELKEVSEGPEQTPMTITPVGDLYMPLEGLIDVEKEKARLEREVAKATTDLEREEKKLSNTQMIAKAPAEKVAAWKALAEESKSKLEKLQAQLAKLV